MHRSVCTLLLFFTLFHLAKAADYSGQWLKGIECDSIKIFPMELKGEKLPFNGINFFRNKRRVLSLVVANEASGKYFPIYQIVVQDRLQKASGRCAFILGDDGQTLQCTLKSFPRIEFKIAPNPLVNSGHCVEGSVSADGNPLQCDSLEWSTIAGMNAAYTRIMVLNNHKVVFEVLTETKIRTFDDGLKYVRILQGYDPIENIPTDAKGTCIFTKYDKDHSTEYSCTVILSGKAIKMDFVSNPNPAAKFVVQGFCAADSKTENGQSISCTGMKVESVDGNFNFVLMQGNEPVITITTTQDKDIYKIVRGYNHRKKVSFDLSGSCALTKTDFICNALDGDLPATIHLVLAKKDDSL
jgi:hypothetical protein